MDKRAGFWAALVLIILACVIGSCQSSADLAASATYSPPTWTPYTPTQTPLPSQTPTPWPTRIPQTASNCPPGGWTLFTTYNGLASSGISTITAAEDGVIWLGFYNGNVSWIYNDTIFTLPRGNSYTSSQVNVIIPWEKGGVWIGTQGGEVALYEDNQWIYNSYLLPIEKGGTTSVYDLAISPQDQVWAATWEGLLKLEEKEWVAIEKPVSEDTLYSPKSLYFDQEGGLWVGARRSLMYYQDGSWSYPPSRPLDFFDIEAIEEDSNGNLWFGGRGGVFQWNGESWMKMLPAEEGDLESDGSVMVNNLSIGSDDRVWAVTSDQTLVFEDGSWLPVTLGAGSPESRISYVDVDPWGAVWFATQEGLQCYLP